MGLVGWEGTDRGSLPGEVAEWRISLMELVVSCAQAGGPVPSGFQDVGCSPE